MNKHFSSLQQLLIQQKRWKKTLLLIIADYSLLVISFQFSLSIRINNWFWPATQAETLLIFVIPIIAIPIFYISGLYQSFIRYTNIYSLKIIMRGISFYTVIWFLLVLIPNLIVKPYDFLIINWLLTVFFIGGIRFIARSILFVSPETSLVKNVLIFGAGYSGTRLGSAIQTDPGINLIGYIDDDNQKHGLYVEGKRIFKRNDIENLIIKKNIDEIFIAMPSLHKSDFSTIIDYLKQYSVTLRKIPDIVDLAQGKIVFSDLRRINIEDLLHREVRAPDETLLSKDIRGKNILVTGAGGSVGSELCREIIKLSPKKLILFEISEFALYELERELVDNNPKDNILSILGDINERESIRPILKKYNIQTVFHAAAYKHVPMVEKNVLPAVRTNIFGTLQCINAAVDLGVNSFVFISTDKAVRPTNIMGASKRFAEILLQAITKEQRNMKKNETRISMVRFGNVLGSSGSVVPLFSKQIEAGGPITVTDPEIIRYFMTITEAAQLVIQAGAMGKDGEVFLLDMGEPVKILELAKDMINLSGLSLRDKDNPNGDIEIIFTGLRSGEKLYEELLVDDNAIETKHKKIMIADEKVTDLKELEVPLKNLEKASETQNYELIQKVFCEIVEGYNSSS